MEGDPRPELDRILIVDDDLETRLALAHTLQEASYQVWQTGNGKVAIAAIAASSPDLILLDVEMPDMDGFEVYRAVRETELGRDVPVLFMSGARLSESDVIRALHGGASDYLRRPFGRLEVLARVEVALRNRRTQLELVRLGTTDALTSLLNRRALFESLERERRRAQRSGLALSVVLLDVDKFKTVNDTYGHPAGDRVLQAVARALQLHCRATDIVGRIGGEEFAVVLPATDEAGAYGFSEKLRQAVSSIDPEFGPGSTLRITASLGLATATGTALDRAEDALLLIARADAGLYDAKRGGRDRVGLPRGIQGS